MPVLTILLRIDALIYLQTRLSRESQTAEPQGLWPQGHEVPPQERPWHPGWGLQDNVGLNSSAKWSIGHVELLKDVNLVASDVIAIRGKL